MKCEFLNEISAFVDGELNERQKAELLKHLEDCPQCKKALEDYRALREKFARAKFPEISPSFEEKVLMRIKQKPILRKFAPVLPFAVAFALLLIGLFLRGKYHPSDVLLSDEEVVVMEEELFESFWEGL